MIKFFIFKVLDRSFCRNEIHLGRPCRICSPKPMLAGQKFGKKWTASLKCIALALCRLLKVIGSLEIVIDVLNREQVLSLQRILTC